MTRHPERRTAFWSEPRRRRAPLTAGLTRRLDDTPTRPQPRVPDVPVPHRRRPRQQARPSSSTHVDATNRRLGVRLRHRHPRGVASSATAPPTHRTRTERSARGVLEQRDNAAQARPRPPGVWRYRTSAESCSVLSRGVACRRHGELSGVDWVPALEEVAAALDAGDRVVDIARRAGCSPRSIRNVAHRGGLALPQARLARCAMPA